jgi:septum formation protein
MSLILASSSPVRARLLTAAGVTFDVVPARIDEDMLTESLLADGAQAQDVAEKLAELKAQKISASHPGMLVVGADQVLVFQGEIIGKSPNVAETRALLRRLAGQAHRLIAAVVLAKDGAILWRHVAQAELHMRNFSDGFLDSYLAAQGDFVLGSVGCYHLEGEGAQFFSKISGDYFTVLGLPLLPLLGALREFGVIPI